MSYKAMTRIQQLAHHLYEATRLVKEIGEDELPLAAPGRGYLDWYMLKWLSDAVPRGARQ